MLGNTPIDPTFVNYIRGEVDRFRPDVVIGHTPVPFAAEAAEAAAHRAGVPFVTTYHAGRLAGSSKLLQSFATLNQITFERRMLERSRHLIAVSGYVRDQPLARHRDRVTVVPPGVDAARFTPASQPTGNDVLFVAPLSSAYRWKGVDTLWGAFRRVKEAVPTAGLTLAGQGDRFNEFYQRAATTAGVRLVGHVSDEKLVAAYQDASVVVLPSTSDAEGFGMVLAEANACGRPVVGSRIGGIPDFVKDGENGFLASPGDPVDLADRIITLLRDKDLARRMGRSGRTKVVREHDWADLSVKTERVLESVLQERPVRSAAEPSPSLGLLGRRAT